MSKLEKMTIRLREGDIAYLSAAFPTQGYNKALQLIVANFVDRHREAVNRELSLDTAIPEIDLDL